MSLQTETCLDQNQADDRRDVWSLLVSVGRDIVARIGSNRD